MSNSSRSMCDINMVFSSADLTKVFVSQSHVMSKFGHLLWKYDIFVGSWCPQFFFQISSATNLVALHSLVNF